MDIPYIKYCLKVFFISDFKQHEIASILNHSEPEKYSREYLASLNFNKRHEDIMRIKLRTLIDKAYAAHVPLGLEKGEFPTLEDAYVFRQRYISKYLKTANLISTLNKFIVAVVLGIISVFIVLMLS